MPDLFFAEMLLMLGRAGTAARYHESGRSKPTTHDEALALLPGSPAIDAGDGAELGAPLNLTTDQRGFPRRSRAHVDIGAYEWQGATVLEPSRLINPARLGNGEFRFEFTNATGATFTVLASTNVALSVSDWAELGGVPEISFGHYQFTDPQTTNSLQRFYRLLSP